MSPPEGLRLVMFSKSLNELKRLCVTVGFENRALRKAARLELVRRKVAVKDIPILQSPMKPIDDVPPEITNNQTKQPSESECSKDGPKKSELIEQRQDDVPRRRPESSRWDRESYQGNDSRYNGRRTDDRPSREDRPNRDSRPSRDSRSSRRDHDRPYSRRSPRRNSPEPTANAFLRGLEIAQAIVDAPQKDQGNFDSGMMTGSMEMSLDQPTSQFRSSHGNNLPVPQNLLNVNDSDLQQMSPFGPPGLSMNPQMMPNPQFLPMPPFPMNFFNVDGPRLPQMTPFGPPGLTMMPNPQFLPMPPIPMNLVNADLGVPQNLGNRAREKLSAERVILNKRDRSPIQFSDNSNHRSEDIRTVSFVPNDRYKRDGFLPSGSSGSGLLGEKSNRFEPTRKNPSVGPFKILVKRKNLNTPMTNNDMEIFEELLCSVLKQVHGSPPKILDTVKKGPVIIITCEDVSSKEWLLQYVPLLTLEGKELTCLAENDGTLVELVFPLSSKSATELINRLEYLNEGLNTFLWEVVSERRGEATVVSAKVPDSSISFFKKANNILFFGLKPVQVLYGNK